MDVIVRSVQLPRGRQSEPVRNVRCQSLSAARKNNLLFMTIRGTSLSRDDSRSDLGGLSFQAAECGFQRHGNAVKVNVVNGTLSRDTHLRFLRR